jgi:hypothetical protein
MHFFISSARKYEKLYLFMGRANKNTNNHINKQHLQAIRTGEIPQKQV